MTSKILFLIGSGANIGAATVKTFLTAGWRVAQASRSAKTEDSTPDNLHLFVDLAKPETVTEAFKEVRAKLGELNAVIYNAAAHHMGGAPNPLFHPALSDFTTDLTINTTSAFVAAREALTSFQSPSRSSPSIPKTFSYTGNLLNEQNPTPGLLTLGVGKNATAYMIAEADAVYGNRETSPVKGGGARFYYVAERLEDGRSPYQAISGQGHAEFFLELAEGRAGDDVPWQATFVSGKGYTKFAYRGMQL
ncbi:Putative short-chain dehydrogenase/reductase SDR, NAD(P)-binding domain superfamily [Septoria linicola]|uniref:Short-chain dehydrogenase/reductase SDR, NAD(P)-binding domain superfamily n=1 Tax=Septoria linicola TaxID=215465 RepID=A0A9Q9AMF9_9PEZI|nr:Putative short-chain dehydrogenase/reductase SDR, NAD(P)-binding domain superfamily [Septoria linicola]